MTPPGNQEGHLVGQSRPFRKRKPLPDWSNGTRAAGETPQIRKGKTSPVLVEAPVTSCGFSEFICARADRLPFCGDVFAESRVGANHHSRIETAAVAGSRSQDAPQGDAVNGPLPAGLRAETTMPVGWNAGRLGMGTRVYLHHLYRRRKSGRD